MQTGLPLHLQATNFKGQHTQGAHKAKADKLGAQLVKYLVLQQKKLGTQSYVLASDWRLQGSW